MPLASKAYAIANPDKVREIQTLRGVRYVKIEKQIKPCKEGKIRAGKPNKDGTLKCITPKEEAKPLPEFKNNNCKPGKVPLGKPKKDGTKRCINPPKEKTIKPTMPKQERMEIVHNRDDERELMKLIRKRDQKGIDKFLRRTKRRLERNIEFDKTDERNKKY